MAVVDNFNFFYFLRLMWKFLNLESECGGSVCWPNNKIIDSSYFDDLAKDNKKRKEIISSIWFNYRLNQRSCLSAVG